MQLLVEDNLTMSSRPQVKLMNLSSKIPMLNHLNTLSATKTLSQGIKSMICDFVHFPHGCFVDNMSQISTSRLARFDGFGQCKSYLAVGVNCKV